MRPCFFFKFLFDPRLEFEARGLWPICIVKKTDAGLLLSQSLSCKAYKTYIAAIYFKIVQKQKYRMSI